MLEVYKAIRAQVGEGFAVGIKLNSADFQRGGFSEEESIELIRTLSQAGIDLIEISGGTYEAPAMALKILAKQSTRERENPTLDFAEKRAPITSPLSGDRWLFVLAGMNQALESGALDMIGPGPLAGYQPDAPLRLVQGKRSRQQVKPISTGHKSGG